MGRVIPYLKPETLIRLRGSHVKGFRKTEKEVVQGKG